jgi:hypothetical protein
MHGCPFFLLAYRASTHDTTGLFPVSLVFGRHLRLSSDFLFGAPAQKELQTVDYATDLVEHLQEIQNYGRQHLQVASNRMKTRYNKLTNCADYQDEAHVWL